MADEAPKLIQIGKGGPGIKKDGFNLISEKVVKVDVENRTLEIELLAYEGKNVVLEVGEDLVEELKKIKPGDGVTVRVVEEEPGGTLHGAPTKRRIVKGLTIRSRDAQKTRVEEMLAALNESHWLTRKYAVEVLGNLGDPRAVGPLIEALTDEVNDIRQRDHPQNRQTGRRALDGGHAHSRRDPSGTHPQAARPDGVQAEAEDRSDVITCLPWRGRLVGRPTCSGSRVTPCGPARTRCGGPQRRALSDSA